MPYKVNYKIAGLGEIIDHVGGVYNHFIDTYINSLLDPSIREILPVCVDAHLLASAIEHARIDLSRWVDFHLADGDSLPDNHKYAGFISKWIAKFRPIYVRTPNDFKGNYPPELYKINAIFATFVFRSYVKSDIPIKLIKELVYRLHFRDETSENLAFFAFACEALKDAS